MKGHVQTCSTCVTLKFEMAVAFGQEPIPYTWAEQVPNVTTANTAAIK